MAAADWDRENGLALITKNEQGGNRLTIENSSYGHILVKEAEVDQSNVRLECEFIVGSDSKTRGLQLGLRVDPVSTVPGAGIWVGSQNGISGSDLMMLTFFSINTGGVITSERTGVPIASLSAGTVVKVFVVLDGNDLVAYLMQSTIHLATMNDDISTFANNFTSPVAGKRRVGCGRMADSVLAESLIDNFVVKEVS